MWKRCLLTLMVGSLAEPLEHLRLSNSESPLIYGFEVDYGNNQFLLDGKPFRYVSGSFHYFRTPKIYWRDRLRKIRAAGLNAVSTYVEWSFHQPRPNTWTWTGGADIVEFLTIAQEEDLLVLLRPGPYICAERDLGGLPAWLMTLEPNIRMRTNDQRFMHYVAIYINELFTRVRHLLRGNGGPIIMVQVENEYGSFHACDTDYKENLRNLIFEHVGSNALLYTTDGTNDNYLRCGVIPGAYATIDFGSNTDIQKNFNLFRRYQPSGPLVNSEYYSGWLTHWGEQFQTVTTEAFIKSLKIMLAMNASVNIYMFYGGTNFGFTAGANGDDKYWPQITSYDYDAPLNEAGDPTNKYFAIRDAIAQFLPIPNLPLPSVSPKGDYGSVHFEAVLKLFDSEAKTLFGMGMSYYIAPPTFEELSLGVGFVLYETGCLFEKENPAILHATVADRGLVYVNNYLAGTLSRTLKIQTLVLEDEVKKLTIFVENQGHLNYGNIIEDWKGIFNVQINGKNLTSWNVTGFKMDNVSSLKTFKGRNITTGNLLHGPVFLRAIFTINEQPLDTYLNTADWGKGVAYINGYNLGRYWPQTGPQITLYVPSIYLRIGLNEIIVLELEYVPHAMNMTFQTTADFGSTSEVTTAKKLC